MTHGKKHTGTHFYLIVAADVPSALYDGLIGRYVAAVHADD